MKSTCLEKYGVENVFTSSRTQQKIIDTNMEKYGVPYAIMNENVKAKQIQSMINNHNNKYKLEDMHLLYKDSAYNESNLLSYKHKK